MKRIRIDDVMWASKPFEGKEEKQLKKYINWAKDADVYVTLAILCKDLEKYPELMKWLVEQEDIGFDLHGWEHVRYDKMNLDDIVSHLDQAIAWMDDNGFGVPFRWATPWGADSWDMQRAAKEVGLVIETTEDPVVDERVAAKMVFDSGSTKCLKDKVIMSHWWNRGLSLYRVCQVEKHGSIQEAIEKSDEPESEKVKIWKGWS